MQDSWVVLCVQIPWCIVMIWVLVWECGTEFFVCSAVSAVWCWVWDSDQIQWTGYCWGYHIVHVRQMYMSLPSFTWYSLFCFRTEISNIDSVIGEIDVRYVLALKFFWGVVNVLFYSQHPFKNSYTPWYSLWPSLTSTVSRASELYI